MFMEYHRQNLIDRKQYMQQLRNLKDQNIIKVVSGVRRCGKSTLLMMFADELLQNGVNQEQIQFYNFEDLDTLAIGDIYKIHTHIKEQLITDSPNYIFLDEIQNVRDFQRLVDSLYIKPNVDVYITGSNAYMLSGELATLLTGRYIQIHVLPLSFKEYLSYYELFFNTRKSIKELFFTMWDTGIWLIFYGFFIFLGFMGIADCILLAPFTTSGIIMFENMIVLFFNMIHAAAKLNINTENKNDKTLDRAWGIAKKELLKMGIKLSMILLAILIPLVIIVRDSVAAVEIMWGISVILGIIQLLRLIIKMVINV